MSSEFLSREWYNEALQTVKSMVVQVTPCGDEVRYSNTLTFKYPEGATLSSQERCQWSKCKDGGLELTKVISSIIRSKQAHTEETVRCEGAWTSPKGKVVYEHCDNYWKIVVDIVFKADEPTTGTQNN